MNLTHITVIAEELHLVKKQVQATAALLEEGATVPFIARYRKEVTGSLDEVAITTSRDRLAQVAELDKRRETILRSVADQGKLTDALQAKMLAALSLTILEDLYLTGRLVPSLSTKTTDACDYRQRKRLGTARPAPLGTGHV
jgi:uncharacterized protein